MDRENRTQSGGTEDRGVYIISVAAELVGMHPQTLRIYERKGLLSPSRTRGNTRRYSDRDIRRLRTIQRLTADGVSLAGVQMILDMENQLEALEARMAEMRGEVERGRVRALQEIERIRREGRAEIVPMAEVRRQNAPIRQSGRIPPRHGPIVLGPGDPPTTRRTS